MVLEVAPVASMLRASADGKLARRKGKTVASRNPDLSRGAETVVAAKNAITAKEAAAGATEP